MTAEKAHASTYTYEDEQGNSLYIVYRKDESDGKRIWVGRSDGQSGYGPRRVLYRLPEVTAASVIVVVEGEKKCDALARTLGPGQTVTTAPGGANGIRRVEVAPLVRKGLKIIVWRDADDAGAGWEANLYRRLRLAYDESGLDLDMSFIIPPKTAPKGWDCGDAVHEHLNVAEILAGAVPEREWKVRSGYAAKELPPAWIAEELLGILPEMITTEAGLWVWNTDKSIWMEMEPGLVKRRITHYMGGSATSRRVNDVLDLIKAKTYQRDPFGEGNANLIPVKNGDIVLRHYGDGWGYDLGPAYPESYVRFRIDIPFYQECEISQKFGKDGAEVPTEPVRFLKLLRRLWAGEPDIEDRIRLMQQIFGYCLYRQCPIPAVFIFWGKSMTGKSTVIDILQGFLDRQNVANVLPKDFAHRFRPAALRDKLANLVREIPEGQQLPDDMVKLLADGVYIQVERKGIDAFDVRLTAKHVLATNHIPWSRDVSEAMLRRIIILTFPNQIPAAEQKRGLAEAITGGVLEKELLLQWALDGLIDLLNAGHFVCPASSKSALADWQKDWDNVAGFVDECCHVARGRTCSTSSIYSAYQRYCEDYGYHALALKNFRNRLLEISSVTYKRTSSWRGFCGIELESERSDVSLSQPYAPPRQNAVDAFFPLIHDADVGEADPQRKIGEDTLQ